MSFGDHGGDARFRRRQIEQCLQDFGRGTRLLND
jgi:hypothetical protein